MLKTMGKHGIIMGFLILTTPAVALAENNPFVKNSSPESRMNTMEIELNQMRSEQEMIRQQIDLIEMSRQANNAGLIDALEDASSGLDGDELNKDDFIGKINGKCMYISNHNGKDIYIANKCD